MKGPNYAVKVGLFVLAGIVVLAAMVAIFSKSGSLFTQAYELRLRANNVSGLKPGSAVLMSGVPVGAVQRAEFAPDGKGVIITVRIERKNTIHADARFVIEQIGLLGDQYVAIYPEANQGPVLQPGDTVPVREPFNFQETVHSATELVGDLKESTKAVNTLIARIDRTVLSEASLSNATVAVANFRLLSQRVLTMVEGVNQLVETNSRPIFLSVSNLVLFSQEMDLLASELQQVVATNKVELAQGIRSLDATARVLEKLTRSVEQGQGLAGALVQDNALKESFVQMVQNLQTVSSNISYHGLLYKPRHPKTNAPAPSLQSQPKTPFQ
jgi:phospholipid/cholesterol/gamma-HCH transport system substrate-binding protein